MTQLHSTPVIFFLLILFEVCISAKCKKQSALILFYSIFFDSIKKCLLAKSIKAILKK